MKRYKWNEKDILIAKLLYDVGYDYSADRKWGKIKGYDLDAIAKIIGCPLSSLEMRLCSFKNIDKSNPNVGLYNSKKQIKLVKKILI